MTDNLTRREFLRNSGLAATAGFIPDLPFVFSPDGEAGLDVLSPETSDHLAAIAVNDRTAKITAATFAGSVGLVAGTKLEFENTFPFVSVAEAYRLHKMRDVLPEEYEEEVEELRSSLYLVPPLVALAEVGSSIKGDISALLYDEVTQFHRRKVSEKLAMDDLKAKTHEVQDLRELDVNEISEKLRQYKDEVVSIIASNAALSSVLAPLATTYASSGAAKDAFPVLISALTKAYHASSILERKRNNIELTEEEEAMILQEALDKATLKVSGPKPEDRKYKVPQPDKSYSALSLAQSSNLAGMALWGDPPMLASLMINKDAIEHFSDSLEGFGYSQLASLAGNMYWLKSLNLDYSPANMGFYMKEYGSYFVETTKRIKNTLAKRKYRDTGLFGNRIQMEMLASRLNQVGHGEVTQRTVNSLQESLHKIHDIPRIIEFDIESFLAAKGIGLQDFIQKAFVKAGLANMPEEVDFSIYETRQEAFNAIQEIYQDPVRRSEVLAQYDQYLAEQNKQRLQQTFLDLLKCKPADAEALNELSSITKEIFGDERDPEHILKEAEEAFGEMDSLGAEASEEAKAKFMKRLSVLGRIGPTELKVVYNAARQEYERNGDQHGEEHKGRFGLNSESWEVATALLDQLPAVPALIRVCKGFLRDQFGISIDHGVEGEKITPELAEKMMPVILELTAFISSSADNVAAYLFGKKMLEFIFNEAYASDEVAIDEVLEKYPSLRKFINKSALFTAVAAGSLSKIGNGANFLMKKISAELQGREIKTKFEEVDMIGSVANVYSHVQTQAIILFMNTEYHVLKNTGRLTKTASQIDNDEDDEDHSEETFYDRWRRYDQARKAAA